MYSYMYSLINILYILSQFPTTISKNLRFESRFFHMLQFFPLSFSPFGFIRLDKFHFIISQSLDRFVKRYRADFYPARTPPPSPHPEKATIFHERFFPIWRYINLHRDRKTRVRVTRFASSMARDKLKIDSARIIFSIVERFPVIETPVPLERKIRNVDYFARPTILPPCSPRYKIKSCK